MAGVTGLGGAFIRADDPAGLYAWYEQHLGMAVSHGCFVFPAASERASLTVAFFGRQDQYFPPAQPAMLNFQVDDLDALLDQLQAAGATVDPNRESYDYGRFGWFNDPEGNRVELWQPSS